MKLNELDSVDEPEQKGANCFRVLEGCADTPELLARSGESGGDDAMAPHENTSRWGFGAVRR